MKSIVNRIVMFTRDKDFFAKAACLVLSIVLWAYLSSDSADELQFKIRIDYKNLPPNLTVIHKSEKLVTVILEGKKGYLNNINKKSIKPYVDLSKPKIGRTKSYPINLVRNDIPEGVSVTFSRSNIRLKVDRIIEKKVLVKVINITGTVKKGKVAGKPKITPEYISVVGAKSLLKNIRYIYAKEISIEGMDDDVIREAELITDNLKEVKIREKKVNVIIPVIESGNQYSLNAPVLIKNLNKKYRYTIISPMVRIYIKSSENKKIVVEDIDAFVDVGAVNIKRIMKKMDMDEIVKDFPVDVVMKKDIPGVSIISIVPETVTLKIFKK